MRIIRILIITLLIAGLFAPIITVANATPAVTTNRTTPQGMDYTQVTGTLGDAAYIIQIPEDWNGMLVVACPWYQYPADNLNCHLLYQPTSEALLSMGFAFACSNYGATGWPTTEAVLRIHQLTEYVVGKYDVTGKVFVMGGSMGGAVAILVGEKYPELYSGVLDLCGAKNLAVTVNACIIVSQSTLEEIKIMRGMPATTPNSVVQGFKDFCISIMNDALTETGGTPDQKPQVYSKIDPNQQTDISIPIISVVGALDTVVPPSNVITYHQALVSAGTGDLHKYYIVSNGGHINAPIFATVPTRLLELVAWSDSIDYVLKLIAPNFSFFW